MVVRLVLFSGLLAFGGAVRVEHIESELDRLPRLFHLDDYERCMASKGIFCMGQFLLHSDAEDHPLVGIIEKYSQDSDLYNRSYLHRGYCVSSRCPGNESNLTARFESCVDKLVRRSHGLRARLMQLSYCKEHGKPLPLSPDTSDWQHRLFLYVVLALLALNIIGTIYDLQVEENKNSDEFIRKWSVRQNWRLLIKGAGPHDEIGLDSLNGIKTFLLSWTPLCCHAAILITAMYQFNPRTMEKFLMTPFGPAVGSLTLVTQLSLIFTVFLTTYEILKSKDTVNSIPKHIIRRLVRMLPVYLLVIGFSATWWTSFGDGPMWHHLFEPESQNCRRKFWLMTAFLHNVIDAKYICNVQTWILGVSMQTHIPVLFLAFYLRNYRKQAHWIFSAMFAASLAITGHVAFKNGYKPAYTYFDPENYRTMFAGNDSFNDFFLGPLNCLAAIVVGLWTAFIHNDIREKGIKLEGRFWEFMTYFLMFMLLYVSCYAAYLKLAITDPWYVTSMIVVERIYYNIVMGALVIVLINVRSKLTTFLQCYIVRPVSRMAVGIAMAHWCVNGILIGNRYAPHESSFRVMIQDTLAVLVITFAVALPLTVMLDLPMKRSLDKYINKLPS